MARAIFIVAVYAAVVLLIVMLVGCLDMYLHTASGWRRPPPPSPKSLVREEYDVQISRSKFDLGKRGRGCRGRRPELVRLPTA